MIRRSKVDKRARAALAKIGFGVAYFVVLLFWMSYNVSKEWELFRNVAFYGLLFGSAGTVVFLLRRRYRGPGRVLTESVTGTNASAVRNDVPAAISDYLQQRAMILSSLVARAAGEITVQSGGVPEGAQVVTRQTRNEFLRENCLWGKLERDEKDLMSMPDGSWTVDQQLKITVWGEQLRLLRWVLGIDRELVPLFHLRRLDSKLVREMVDQQAKLTTHGRRLRSWDVRVERDEAEQYAGRVIAELKGRSLMPRDPAQGEWVNEVRRIFLGPSDDFIAGVKTVGELSDEDLTYLWAVVSARERYASYLVDQLSTDYPFPFSLWLRRNEGVEQPAVGPT